MIFLIIMQKIKADWYDSLPLEKKLILHNIIILIKPVFKKNQLNTNIIYIKQCLWKYI